MAEKYTLPKVEELLSAGVHFGHQTKRWNPNMEKYIYGTRMGIHVIDLEKTHESLEKACEMLYKVASEGNQIIFVGTKKQARDIIEIEAKRSGALYINERWLGGIVTNFRIIKKNLDKLVDLKRKREEGALKMYTKKERLLIDREIEKLEKAVGGIVSLRGTPSAVFLIDARREKTVIREAKKAKIPVIALVDTNTNPLGIDYVIPGNDDAIRSIAVIVKAVANAVESGYKVYASKLKEGKVESQVVEPKVEEEVPLVSTSEAARASEVAGLNYVEKVVKEVLPEVNEIENFKEVLSPEVGLEAEKEASVKVVEETKPAKKETKVKEVKGTAKRGRPKKEVK